MTKSDWTAAKVSNSQGQGPWLLVCEHASDHIPAELSDLGLNAAARRSHAAWDIGALDVAVALSAVLDAPLVAGGISRLVYDCNRPLSATDCIPARSEIHEIPGNVGLSDTEKQARFDRVHTPFHEAVARLRDARKSPMLVTVHSFTPVFNGVTRDVDLGFLCHSDAATAQALVAHEQADGTFRSALNEPYAPTDGVTYTLEKHAESHGIPAVMIEIRNDLIDTPAKAEEMARHLGHSLTTACRTRHSEAEQ